MRRSWKIRTVYRHYTAMDRHAGLCLWHFWTDEPCYKRATWMASEPESQWRACDEHKMRNDVRIKETKP